MLAVDVITWNTGHSNYIVKDRIADDYCLYLFKCTTVISLEGKDVVTDKYAFILYDIGYNQTFRPAVKEWKLDFVHFSGAEVPELIRELQIPFNTVFYVSDPRFISSMIKKLARETIRLYKMRDITLDIMLRELLLKVSTFLHEISSGTPSIRDIYVNNLRELRRNIVEHPEKEWSVQTMAESMNLSKSHFRKLYLKFHGISPGADLINIRIQKAEYLLNCCGMSVKETATAVGYENEYHFIRIFKEQTGITPGKYLKAHQGGDVDNPYVTPLKK